MRIKFTKQMFSDLSKTIYQFLFNPPLLICLGIAWLITNGWSYIVFTLGIYLDIPILVGIASAYLAFLWVPFTPEKIVTVIIAITLLKKFFPDDEKTLKKLEMLYEKYKTQKDRVKESIKESREIRKESAKEAKEAFVEHLSETNSAINTAIQANKCKHIQKNTT